MLHSRVCAKAMTVPPAGGPECDEASVEDAGSITRGGHRRSFPPSAGDHPGLAYRMAVTCVD